MLLKFNREYPDSRILEYGVLGKRIILSGFDTLSELERAAERGVKDIVLDYFLASTTSQDDLKAVLAPFDLVILDANSVKMSDSTGSEEAFRRMCSQFIMYCDEFLPGLFTAAIEPYKALSVVGQDYYLELRKEMHYRGLPIFPVIHGDTLEFYDEFVLPDLSHAFVVYDASFPSFHYDRLFQMAMRHNVELYGLEVHDPYLIQMRPFRGVTTSAWKLGTKYGSSYFFTEHRLKRFASQNKQTVRAKYKDLIEEAGLDYTKVSQDVVTEVEAMNMWAWQKFGESLEDNFHGAYWLTEEELAKAKEFLVASHVNDPSLQTSLVLQSQDEKRGLILRDNPNLTEVSDSVLKFQDPRTMTGTHCNTCEIRNNCPAFRPNATCAYKTNALVTTREDLQSAVGIVASLALERVKKMAFQENLTGTLNEQTSQEIDRFLKQSKLVGDILKSDLPPSIASQAGGLNISATGSVANDLVGALMNAGKKSDREERTINVHTVSAEDPESGDEPATEDLV